MSETSPYGNFPADLAAQMLDRMIDKSEAEGDERQATEMMSKMFEAAPAADGALSEGLGVTFGKSCGRERACSSWLSDHF